MAFLIRTWLKVGSGTGGSVNIGDTNLYRSAANTLKTDDALTVAGTFTASAGITSTSALTQSGSATFSGTPFVVPYSTSSPTLGANGDVRVYHKAGVAYLAFQSGGTSYAMALPSATDGTATITVNSLP